MGACTQLNPPFPAKYRCDDPATASIKAFCSYSDPGPAHCADHYVLDGDTCVWDGSGTTGEQCPDGYQYDAANLCCTALPGSGQDYPLCPAGYSPVEGPPGVFKCLPGDDPGYVQDSLPLSFNQCTPGCSIGPSDCQYPNCHFNPNTCSCTADPSCG
jgi:hypothetical protein